MRKLATAVTYEEANPIKRFMRRLASLAPISWLFARVLHHIDRPIYRLSRGRYTFTSWVSGLPVVMLTSTGARTGQQRTFPVLGLPDGDNLAVIASNYGQRHNPAWYHNLRAHPAATVTVGGVTRRVQAHEVIGGEWERLWQQALEVYPAWAAYERRAAPRHIPVIMLAPVNDKNA
jgi:deazaflavin-dependent oxidoreductase (nitroreductase family)